MPALNMPKIATKVFNTPLMIVPEKAEIIINNLGSRMISDDANVEFNVSASSNIDESDWATKTDASLISGDLKRRVQSRQNSGISMVGSVAVIGVTGTLVNRGAYLGESSGMTSYEGIRAQLDIALKHKGVKAIVFDVDSYGGAVDGCFDLCARIREVRKHKPVYALLAEHACSAAYAIASQANEITISSTGMAGSIGVVAIHADFSKQVEDQGVNITLIHSGSHKVDFNPYVPLKKSVFNSFQKRLDVNRQQFAEHVAAGRNGKMSAQSALDTEAEIYMGQEALSVGLVDHVGDPVLFFEKIVDQFDGGDGDNSLSISGSSLSNVSSKTVGIAASVSSLSPNTPNKKLGGPLKGLPNLRVDETQTNMESNMPNTNSSASCEATEGQNNDQVDVSADIQGSDVSHETSGNDVAAAVTAERERASKITAKVEKAGLPASFASQLINDNVSLEVAYEKILDKKASTANDGGNIQSAYGENSVVSDVVDRTREGMTKALNARAGLGDGERNEFTGMSMKEMAREHLRSRNVVVSGGAHAVVGAALSASGQHTSDDFGSLLVDVANRSMMRGYNEAEESFEKFTTKGSLSDFRPSKRVNLDLFPELLEIKEGAEYQYGTTGEHSESILLATYGRMFSISRQAIINDDLDAFSKLPAKMGAAARRTVGNMVYAVLSQNPKMADGTVLFHSDHKNLAATGGAPNEANINAGITAMSTQKDRSKNASALNIAPKYIIAGPQNRANILQVLNSEYSPDDSAKSGGTKQSMVYNTVHKAVEPVIDARIKGSSWFLSADPARFDTIEVAYLDGIEAPFIDQTTQWSTDGAEFKVRLDAGVAPMMFESLYKNAG